MSSVKYSLACPVCGFLTFDGHEYGSYEICEICNWEDDAVQLANLASEGGANKGSLLDEQDKILKKYPIEIQNHNGFVRDPQWRPINDNERERYIAEKKENHWSNIGWRNPHFAYWRWGKDIFDDVSQILGAWNPIETPEMLSVDEYKSYVSKVIRNGNSPEEIRNTLKWILTDPLGLEFDEKNERQVKELDGVSKMIFNRLNYK
jgi:hypothetical protein